MVGVWIADITPLYDENRYEIFYRTVPDVRKQKADRLHSAQKKAQSVGVWCLLERIVDKFAWGEIPAFNLSHSGDYVLCAVDMSGNKETEIGCDIERIQKINLKIAERFFCESEYQFIVSQKTKTKQMEAFYRYWVLKESYVKATKKGLSQDTRSFEIQLTSPPKLVKKSKKSKEYYYQEFDISELPYKIAVCSDQNEICTTIKMEFMDLFYNDIPK